MNNEIGIAGNGVDKHGLLREPLTVLFGYFVNVNSIEVLLTHHRERCCVLWAALPVALVVGNRKGLEARHNVEPNELLKVLIRYPTRLLKSKLRSRNNPTKMHKVGGGGARNHGVSGQ
jgi:hypothetical protein